jgi:hypothetical protein
MSSSSSIHHFVIVASLLHQRCVITASSSSPSYRHQLPLVIIAIIGASLVYRDHHQRQTHTQYCDRLLREVQAGEVTIAKLRELESIPAPVFAWLCEHDVITTAKQREGRD